MERMTQRGHLFEISVSKYRGRLRVRLKDIVRVYISEKDVLIKKSVEIAEILIYGEGCAIVIMLYSGKNLQVMGR